MAKRSKTTSGKENLKRVLRRGEKTAAMVNIHQAIDACRMVVNKTKKKVESKLQKGMRVNILQRGKKVDEAVVLRVDVGEIEIESLKLRPGNKTEFGFVPNAGWRVLFEDPFTGARCFSQRAPTYVFEPVS